MEAALSVFNTWASSHIRISGQRFADGLPMASKLLCKKVAVNCSEGCSATQRRYRFQNSLFHVAVKPIGEYKGGWCGRVALVSRLASKRKILARSSVNGGEYEDPNDASLPPALDEVLEYLDVYSQGEPVTPSDRPRNLEGKGSSEAEIGLQDGYVGLFVRLLGLDNPVEEREEAVQALWRHSTGGKEFIDQIVEFPGCLNLIVSLLPSERPASSEAAAGLLRNISSVNAYRSAVAEAGALEEIAGLLTRRSIPSEVKLQATCVLWNLSVEEGPRRKLVQPEILQVLLIMLGSDIIGEREAAAGVIANLTLSPSNHQVLVEAGIIPRLAKILLNEAEESKIARQEVRNALLELARDPNLNLLIIEEGLIPVPLIGASVYRSFKPLLQVAPTLPKNIKVKQTTTKVESKFGAGELLLGLKFENAEIDDATRLNMEGRVRQQFLARIGLLGQKTSKNDQIRDERITLLPWWDGIPRLVLILGLDDLEVTKQAALFIAEIAINEDNRQAVQKAGAIPHLVRLLGSGDEAATAAAAFALDKLAFSRQIRRSIDAHDAPSALVAILKAESVPEYVKEKVVGALFRLSQTGEEVANMAQEDVIPGLVEIVSSENVSSEARQEAEEILDEISTLKADSRDKIVAAGGVPPLVEIMINGSPGHTEKAASVLENLATEESNAAVIMAADVESALKFLLDVKFQEGLVEMSNGRTLSTEDGYMLIGVASRLLEKLARFEHVKTAKFIPLLTNILRSDVPLRVKDWVSACLLKLEQGTGAYAIAIANVGGIFPLVNLLKEGSAESRGAAIAILYSLSMNEDNHAAILAAGAIPCLAELVRRGSS